jgi:menaquinone-dependent protoporphyrinogen IX oxidase
LTDGGFLVRVVIVYDTQYGNTKIVAEKIAEGTRELKGIETEVYDVKEVDPKKLADADAIVVGAPNHIGSPSRTIMKFIDKLSEIESKAKSVAVFNTHLAKDERAIAKMEKKLGEKTPALKLMTAGLDIRVEGMKGPIAGGELPKAIEFGKTIAAQLGT